MDRFVHLRAIVAVIVALQVIVGGTVAFRALTAPEEFVASASPPDPSGLPLTIESGYPTALAIATDWNGAAQLLAVNMQIDWPLAVDPQSPIALAPGGWISYTFVQPDGAGGAEESLSLFFERTSGVLVQQDTLEWPNNQRLELLDPQGLAINSASAIMAIEAREGRDWRAACPVNRHLTRISLTARADTMTTWVVTYADSTSDRAGLLAHLDAERGEITRLDVQTTSCTPP